MGINSQRINLLESCHSLDREADLRITLKRILGTMMMGSRWHWLNMVFNGRLSLQYPSKESVLRIKLSLSFN
jgi:hypothetical protein